MNILLVTGCYNCIHHLFRFRLIDYSCFVVLLQFSLFYILAFFLVICGVFIYNLKPPTRRSTNTESQDKDKSHNRKSDGTASRGGGGLLETQTIDMSTHSRTRSSSVGGLYGSIENEPSKPSNSAISEHAVKPWPFWKSECKCVAYACIPLSVCVHIQLYVLIIM